MKGRKPKPTALKVVTGNPGRRALNKNEPKAPASHAIEPPPTLSAQARVHWDKAVELLESARVITAMDVTALALLCDAHARYQQANEALAKYGMVVKSPSGFPMQSPFLAMANKASEQMLKLLTEFGMTPSSRARVSAVTGGGEEDNPWDAL